jgi:hypothetical protein
LKLLPFVRYEQQSFANSPDTRLNRRNYQFGLTWYPYGQTLNIRSAWTILQRPNDPTIASANQFSIQFQFFSF